MNVKMCSKTHIFSWLRDNEKRTHAVQFSLRVESQRTNENTPVTTTTSEVHSKRYQTYHICQKVDFMNINRYYLPMPSRRRRYRHRPKPEIKKPPANDEITAPEVRLIGINGEQLGVMPTADAIAKAQEEGSDLVMVAEKTNPPVVRILDLGKHIYEKRKKDAKQKAKTKGKDIKGVRIGLKTDEHDWNLRLTQANEFLQSGHKVKVEIRLRGREKQRFDLAEQKLRDFIKGVPGGARQEDSFGRSQHGLTVLLTKLS